MKSMKQRRPFALLTLLLFALLLCAPMPSKVHAAGDKISLEELTAKHLASVGTPEARNAVKSYVIQGTSTSVVRIGGSGTSQGRAVMASEGEMSLIGIIFGSGQEYNSERMAFDGKKFTLGQLQPGTRTNLGGFLLIHEVILREGLLGGILSTAWPLYHLDERQPKLKIVGTKNINGRQAYVVDYEPRKGSNLDIRLYFDAETFHHIRTEYEHDYPPPPVTTPGEGAHQKETRLKLLEDFSDFKTESGLTLPHTYKLHLAFDTPNRPLLQDWTLSLSQFLLGTKEIDPKQFDISGS